MIEFSTSSFWLNLYKPKGISSAKLVSIIKKNLPSAKIGHCGTLDVEAEGVLPLAINEATKLVRLLFDARKTYIFTIQFGAYTDTADASGRILGRTEQIPTIQEANAVCDKFIGTVIQRPPAFSAIKVNGVRSYELARKNIAVPLKNRSIEIYSLEHIESDEKNSRTTYKVECSKGTYIRTLGEDIALSLQSLAYVIELKRVQVGIFTADNAIKLTQLDDTNLGMSKKFLEANSINIEAVLDDILVLDATSEQATKIFHGQKCSFQNHKDADIAWIRHKDKMLAIGSLSENCFNIFRRLNL